MKKISIIMIAFICFFQLIGCGEKNVAEVTIDYGYSEIYSQDDMNSAIQLIKEEFNAWDGCELHSITYSSADECNPDNISWMNELEKANDAKETFTQCIMFTSEFRSPKNSGGGWNSDYEYKGFQWWLARSDGGQWKLMTWGY